MNSKCIDKRRLVYTAIISLLICIAVMAAGSLSASATTYSGEKDGINWTYNTSTYTLTFSSDNENATVKYAEGTAWDKYKTKAKKLVFGDNITGIDYYAFNGYSKVTSISMTNITSLGQECFSYCTSLKTVTIPDNITYWGGSQFYGCSALTTVKFGSNTFADGAIIDMGNPFRDCTSLKTITVADGNENVFIEDSALYFNTIYGIGLCAYIPKATAEKVTIKSGTAQIWSYAFDNNTSITNISIPSTVTSILPHSFNELSSLKYLTIPASVTELGIDGGGDLFPILSDCFACTGITNKSGQKLKTENASSGSYMYYWKNSSTGKYANTFAGTTEKVKQVKHKIYLSGETFWRDGVKYKVATVPDYNNVKNSDLNNQKSVAKVYVVSNPDNKVTPDNINPSKYGNGYYFTVYKYGSVKAVNGIKYKIASTKNKKVYVAGCTSSTVTSVTINRTVTIDGTKYTITGIGKNAFNGYSKLKTITIKNSVITYIGDDSIKGIYSKAKIKVPSSKLSTYKKKFDSDTGFKSTMTITKY